MRIPYDSLTLAAVAEELGAFVEGRVQGVRQPDANTVVLGLYAGGREAMFLLSCHPEFARAHFVTKRPANPPQLPTFCATLRSRIDGGRLVGVRQIAFDRVLELEFETSEGRHVLIAELMGKHANLILVDEAPRVITAAKIVGRGKSSRPIVSGGKYERPPVMGPEGAPPKLGKFLTNLLEARGQSLDEALGGGFRPVLSPGNGAYPLSVAALGLPEFSRASISVALEQYYDLEIPEREAAALKASLLSQFERILLAREAALADLRQAEEQGGRAGRMQRFGELILAFGAAAHEGASVLETADYDGAPVTIKLDPELDYRANANRYFERAKHAKGRLGFVREQIARLAADQDDVLALAARVESETRLDRLRDLQEEARRRRWLTTPAPPAKNKEDRPYEGHRVRELMGPGGVTVLYGENAESNDYLTLRVAKSNDYWLHVRGSQSAHVVIVTRNQPEKISREQLLFAAKVAVQNSPSKHAGYVPVDYTLKKYVRKPKGSPKGTAFYTHEKTLHIES